MTVSSQQTEIAVKRGIRSSILGVIINLALSIAKCLVGIVGHSFALVADGIESLSDVVSSSVVALGYGSQSSRLTRIILTDTGRPNRLPLWW